MIQRCLDLIEASAKIPSFSSFEERIHPFIFSVAETIPNCEITVISERNIVLRVPGKKEGRVALTAHLDKINHFGENFPAELPFERHQDFIKGQLDNTVGIGVVLTLLEQASRQEWPELVVGLSEMEESMGLKNHLNLLRNNGEGLYSGMGAERISNWMIKTNTLPEAIITVDTTPLFKGERGVAVYSKHWEFTKTEPSQAEIDKTARLVNWILELSPDFLHRNNTNDYLTYGKMLNSNSKSAIPSIALEPAIFPYHTRDEQVFISDIHRILQVLEMILDRWQSTDMTL
jgi:hypothetical protein